MRHHAEGLRRLTKDDALVMQLQSDFRRAGIDEQDRAMLEYAIKLTLEPWSMVQVDVEQLAAGGVYRCGHSRHQPDHGLLRFR